MSERRPPMVDVPVSAPGPTHKMVNHKDGTTHVVPGKAHEAREGVVTNPGVRTVSSGHSGPACPNCQQSGGLKMHMNKPVGRRIYCIHCGYDQAKALDGVSGTTSVSAKPRTEITTGVKILRQRGPKG